MPAWSVLGAAAVLTGCTRLGMSNCLIVLESSGAVPMIIPMVLLMIPAKLVADALVVGIYDWQIEAAGYLFLPPEDVLSSSERAVLQHYKVMAKVKSFSVLKYSLIAENAMLQPAVRGVRWDGDMCWLAAQQLACLPGLTRSGASVVLSAMMQVQDLVAVGAHAPSHPAGAGEIAGVGSQDAGSTRWQQDQQPLSRQVALAAGSMSSSGSRQQGGSSHIRLHVRQQSEGSGAARVRSKELAGDASITHPSNDSLSGLRKSSSSATGLMAGEETVLELQPYPAEQQHEQRQEELNPLQHGCFSGNSQPTVQGLLSEGFKRRQAAAGFEPLSSAAATAATTAGAACGPALLVAGDSSIRTAYVAIRELGLDQLPVLVYQSSGLRASPLSDHDSGKDVAQGDVPCDAPVVLHTLERKVRRAAAIACMAGWAAKARALRGCVAPAAYLNMMCSYPVADR